MPHEIDGQEPVRKLRGLHFDPVGQWRTADADGAPLDTRGVLADGSKVDGPVALRNVILSRPEAFATTLTERIMTYALGRGLEYYDRRAVDAVTAAVAKNDYKFSALVAEIVKSDPFRLRRGKNP